MCKKYLSTTLSLVAMLLIVAVSNPVQAFPSFGVSNGNSCSGCHGSDGTGDPASDRPSEFTLAVLGEGLLDLGDGNRNDGKNRGEIPFFTVEPGGSIDLTMEVLDGADAYAVQLKRFEKAAVLGPADTDFLTGYTADADWFDQGPLPNTYYTNAGAFGDIEWAGGPDPWTFTLTIDPNTPENTYDMEFAVAGLNDTTSLKFYSDQHFYVVVASAIPEPSTLFLLGMAGLGICGLKRNR